MHIERTATLHVPLPPGEALPLFTPEGERAWVPDWDPEPIHAPDGTMSREGAVFRTAAGGEETLWLVLRVDVQAGAADYVRVTPDHRIGTVRVRCTPDGPGASTVEVRYRLTALSPAGREALSSVTPAAFEAEIRGWEAAIGELFRERFPAGPS